MLVLVQDNTYVKITYLAGRNVVLAMSDVREV